MSKYKIAIWEEISGFIDVEADSQEKAEELAQELMDECGVEKLFYPHICRDEEERKRLTDHNGKHTHGNREVLGCEEIKSVEGFPVGNDAEFGKSME